MPLISWVDAQQVSNPLWTSTALSIKENVEPKTKLLNLEPPILQKPVKKLIDVSQVIVDISKGLIKRLSHVMVRSGFVVRSAQVWSLAGQVTELFCTSTSITVK